MYKPPKKSVRFREASVKRVSTVYAIYSGLVHFWIRWRKQTGTNPFCARILCFKEAKNLVYCRRNRVIETFSEALTHFRR